MKFNFINHTADLKFLAYGKNLEECFKNSALALNKSMNRDDLTIKSKIIKKFSIKGTDRINLLYNFLEEFLYLFDSENFIMNKINKLEITQNNLSCVISGDINKNLSNNIKAITYNQMYIKCINKKYICQVVLDV